MFNQSYMIRHKCYYYLNEFFSNKTTQFLFPQKVLKITPLLLTLYMSDFSALSHFQKRPVASLNVCQSMRRLLGPSSRSATTEKDRIRSLIHSIQEEMDSSADEDDHLCYPNSTYLHYLLVHLFVSVFDAKRN